MIVSYNKDKILHSIAYLIENTAWFGKTKLYKLLYVLDFEHYKQTGRSVTGFDYFAWKMGPVPAELDEAIDTNAEALTEHFDIEIRGWGKKRKKFYLYPKLKFDAKFFSRREMAILKDVANRFAEANSDEMVLFTHRETEPWHRVWEIEGRRWKHIPYEYALEDLDEEKKEAILETQNERESFLANYQ